MRTRKFSGRLGLVASVCGLGFLGLCVGGCESVSGAFASFNKASSSAERMVDSFETATDDVHRVKNNFRDMRKSVSKFADIDPAY